MTTAATRMSAFRMVKLAMLSLGTACALGGGAAPHESLYVVTVPVADLRAKPGPLATTTSHDPLQETQLLYGERVKVVKREGAWAFVEAVEQAEYTHHRRWQGYPGWIQQDRLRPLSQRPSPALAIIIAKWASVWADANATMTRMRLPMGTKVALAGTSSFDSLRSLRTTLSKGPRPEAAALVEGSGERLSVMLAGGETGWVARADVRSIKELERFSESQRRQAVVRAAEQLLGDPYFWGGRSPHDPTASSGSTQTGVDCSGLVNLAYRTIGLDVPRDAHEQYLRARAIAAPRSADLVFLSEPGNPKKIVHVMLYAGDGWLLEGPGTGLPIRRIEVTERLGRPIHQLKSGQRINRQTLFFGTYLTQ